jgi:hypothetical protein
MPKTNFFHAFEKPTFIDLPVDAGAYRIFAVADHRQQRTSSEHHREQHWP